MTKLLVVIALLGVVWGGVELVAPSIAEGRIEARVAAATEDSAGVTAEVDSFPLVSRLLLTGRVDELSVTFDEFARQRLTFSDLTFDLEGVEVERGALLRRDVEVQSIDQGRVTATIQLGRLGDIFSAAAQLGAFDVAVTDGVLTFERDGELVFSTDLPPDLFPCDPTSSKTTDGVELSCTFTQVPDAFLDAANRSAWGSWGP